MLTIVLVLNLGWRLFLDENSYFTVLSGVELEGDTFKFTVSAVASSSIPTGRFEYKVDGDTLYISFEGGSYIVPYIPHSPVLKLDNAEQIKRINVVEDGEVSQIFLPSNSEWVGECAESGATAPYPERIETFFIQDLFF